MRRFPRLSTENMRTRRIVRVAQGILLVLGIIAAVAALWLTVENVSGRIALRRWEREMRARGEKVTLADLKLPAPSSQPSPLLSAIQKLESRKDDFHLAFGNLYLLKLVAPGKVIVLAREKEPVINTRGFQYNDPLLTQPHGWPDLAAQVNRTCEALEAVRGTESGRLDGGVDYSLGIDVPLPHLTHIRRLDRRLSSAAIVDLHEGRREAALENLAAIAKLGEAMRDEPLLISQLVRIAALNIGAWTTWQALQNEGWSDAQLAKLQGVWEHAGVLDQLPATIEGERAVARITIAQHRSGRKPIDDDMEELFGYAPSQGALHSVVGFWRSVRWKWALSWEDELAYCKMTQETLDLARQAARGGSRASLEEPLSRIRRHADDTAYVLGRPTAARVSHVVTHMAFTFFRYETQREMTVAAVALERFKLRHKTYPSRLEDLVPSLLPSVPRDFMDGKPLRYRKNADGTFTLWSVGENLRDDGGDPTMPKAKEALNWWTAKDPVWPRPATAQEIATALKKQRK